MTAHASRLWRIHAHDPRETVPVLLALRDARPVAGPDEGVPGPRGLPSRENRGEPPMRGLLHSRGGGARAGADGQLRREPGRGACLTRELWSGDHNQQPALRAHRIRHSEVELRRNPIQPIDERGYPPMAFRARARLFDEADLVALRVAEVRHPPVGPTRRRPEEFRPASP